MSDLDRLISDLRTEARVTPDEVRSVVEKGALNIKDDWRNRATGLAHARLYPASIGYDVEEGTGGVEAVIGPDKSLPQGALGNLIEFGSTKNPPHNDGGQALQAEEPRFIAALDRLAGRRL